MVSVSSVVVLGLVIVPQLLAYFTTQDEILQLNQKTVSLEAKAAELEKINPDTSQTQLRVVTSLLPAEPDVPRAITVLQGVVAKSGLLLEGVDYLPAVGNDQRSFQLSVKVSGSLQNIRSFILELRNTPRVFAIETISLRSVQGSRIEADIPVSVYYGVARSTGLKEGDQAALTPEEAILLKKLEALVPLAKAPEATQSAVIAPSVPVGKNDPFE